MMLIEIAKQPQCHNCVTYTFWANNEKKNNLSQGIYNVIGNRIITHWRKKQVARWNNTWVLSPNIKCSYENESLYFNRYLFVCIYKIVNVTWDYQ
jgi:hypothetical protein